MSTNRFRYPFVAWAGGAALLLPVFAHAGGYALNERSASAMGMANAGAAANAENASVVLYNPAGIGYLEGTQVSGGVSVIDVDTDFNGSATNEAGQPVTGNDGGDIVDPAYIPNLAFSHRINEYMSVGLGMSVPYGITADYDDRFVGRYFGDETELHAIDIQPTLAFNNDDGFALGVSLNVVRAEGKLTKFQDYSAFGTPEGYFEAEGDDWAVGVTAGMLFQPFERTTLGLTYRSSIELELEGDASITNVPNPLTGQLMTLSEDVVVPLETPESLSFSLKQGLSEDWTVFAGATWTRWSRFEDLDIISAQDNAGSPGTISNLGSNTFGGEDIVGHVTQAWQDTWSFAIGTKWQATDAWAFKAGYAFDESPIQEQYRTTRIPDNDRNWLTLGAQWKSRDDLSIDLAAGYLIIEDADVEEVEYTVADQPVGGPATVQGSYELDAWGAALQVSKAF